MALKHAPQSAPNRSGDCCGAGQSSHTFIFSGFFSCSPDSWQSQISRLRQTATFMAFHSELYFQLLIMCQCHTSLVHDKMTRLDFACINVVYNCMLMCTFIYTGFNHRVRSAFGQMFRMTLLFQLFNQEFILGAESSI